MVTEERRGDLISKNEEDVRLPGVSGWPLPGRWGVIDRGWGSTGSRVDGFHVSSAIGMTVEGSSASSCISDVVGEGGGNSGPRSRLYVTREESDRVGRVS